MKEHDKEKKQLALEYMEEGKAAFYDKRLNEAALLVQTSMHLFQETESYEDFILALNLMGVIHVAAGNDSASIDYFLEGLSFATDHQFFSYTCLFYNNIGSRYQQLNCHGQAIDYFLKAESALDLTKSQDAQRYNLWHLITFLNLSASYSELNQFPLAEKYLEKAAPFLTGEIVVTHQHTFLIVQCKLYWAIGRRDFVYQHLDKLIESGDSDKNTSDYIQDMKNLCDLLMKMKEYDKWKKIIFSVKNYAIEQNSVYFHMVVTEMWMDYCQATGNAEGYHQACVSHAKLYQKQREISNLEKAAAIDIKVELREKENEKKEAEQKANIDSLTGLGNRYLMESDIQASIKEALDLGRSLTIGILDIDCFKQINDTYGHIQGDKCLKTVANILTQSLIGIGKAYRFGGDEFILLLDPVDKETIQNFAEKVKELLHKEHIENNNSSVVPELTVSQGYSCFRPITGESSKMAISHADKALYQVKENGKNSYQLIIEDT